MTTAPFSRIRFVLGLMLLAGWSGAAVVALVAWDARRPMEPPRAFAPPAYGCTIEMPGPPQDVLLLGTQESREYSQYAAVLRHPWERYGLALVTSQPFDFNLDQPYADLEALLTQFQSQHRLSAGVPPRFTTAADGLLTADAEYRSVDFGTVVVRIVGAASRRYLLVVAGPDVSAIRPEIVRYFDSFRITDPDFLDAAKRREQFRQNRLRRDARVKRAAEALYLDPAANLPAPLLYWPCDEVEDEETLEVMQRNDSFVSNAKSVKSPAGRGLRFPSEAEPALIEELEVDLPPPWTIGLWVKVPTGDVEVLRTEGARIVFRQNRLRFQRFDWAGPVDVVVATKPEPGTWVHLAVLCSGFGNLSGYLNGELLEGKPGLQASQDRMILRNLAVGFHRGAEPLDMEIDELVLFRVNLNVHQIRTLATFTSDPK